MWALLNSIYPHYNHPNLYQAIHLSTKEKEKLWKQKSSQEIYSKGKIVPARHFMQENLWNQKDRSQRKQNFQMTVQLRSQTLWKRKNCGLCIK